jgi:aspartate kinase
VKPVNSRVVIKFGGADLSTGTKVRHAAELVVKSPYREKVVVVSAMGNATDSLVNTITEIGGVNDEDYAEVLSMGERTSARVSCSALRALGGKAVVFDPSDENWPIITDYSFRDAKPDVEQTRALVQKFVLPLLPEAIPVICGFLGRDPEGHVTTLGRGGSDTTALLLAKCLEAEEVILVKETSGVHSADPRVVPEARPLDKLDVHEMFDLAQGGARIVKPESLRHKLPGQKLRIVNFASGSLAEGGTEITGSINVNSAEMNSQRNLLAINVVCEVNAENVRQVFSALSQKPIYGVSSGSRSLTVFTTDGNLRDVLNRLHNVEGFRAISHRENVALLQVSHPLFIDSPGGVAKISGALSQRGINIIEVTTSKATINVFIEENQLNKAMEAISHVHET